MTRRPSVLRAMLATAAVAVLALSVGLSAVAPSNAATTEPSPTCGLICFPVPSESHSPRPTPTGQPPSATVKPPAPTQAPPPPPQPAEPAPAPVPTLAPEPGETAVQEAPSAPAATSATPYTGPSTESNWNKPFTRSASPTQAAAASRGGGPGFGNPGLLSIMAGVLLVGLGGLAFAWWGRNRPSTH